MTRPASGLERRLLQGAIILACTLPLLGGAIGMINGVEPVAGLELAQRLRLDSHYRYLSGLLFTLGLAFLSCVPRIERRGPRLRLLGAMVVVGGLARLHSMFAVGAPDGIHLVALGMELGVVPAIIAWQWRFALRAQRRPAVNR